MNKPATRFYDVAVLALLWDLMGCRRLILRTRWAIALLIASLPGVLAQDFSLFAWMDGVHVAVVLLVAIGLALLARWINARGWLA